MLPLSPQGTPREPRNPATASGTFLTDILISRYVEAPPKSVICPPVQPVGPARLAHDKSHNVMPGMTSASRATSLRQLSQCVEATTCKDLLGAAYIAQSRSRSKGVVTCPQGKGGPVLMRRCQISLVSNVILGGKRSVYRAQCSHSQCWCAEKLVYM